MKNKDLLVKLVKKPGGTPANQHPMLTTCIQNTACAGEQLCCCFDQREADQMNLWEAVLGFVLVMSFMGFLGGSQVLFWEHFRLFCLQMLFVCLFMFFCILGYIFKDNISLTSYHMMWLGVWLWLKKKPLSCYGICLISKTFVIVF